MAEFPAGRLSSLLTIWPEGHDSYGLCSWRLDLMLNSEVPIYFNRSSTGQ